MEEDDDLQPYEWWEDEEFVAELDERVRRYEAGIDRGYTLEETKAKIDQLRQERLNKYNKEIEEGETQIDKGNFLTHDEVKKYFADKGTIRTFQIKRGRLIFALVGVITNKYLNAVIMQRLSLPHSCW
ncbi:MAG: hypothetical protein V4553_11440 [Bacteroidota bacterium]